MRLPNGYGSVTKLSGNRRRPYIVKKTIGYNSKGHPKYDIVGYTKTKQEGLQLLAEYNNNPYDVDAAKITTKELIDKYIQTKKFLNYADSTQGHMKRYIKKMKSLYDLPYREVKASQMQYIVDEQPSYSSQGTARNWFVHLDDYALKNDIITKKYSDTIDTEKTKPTKVHNIYTEKEINTLWNNLSTLYVDSILILLYTGFRASEVTDIKLSDINMENKTIVGGGKTKAGTDRVVPIHSKILPIIEDILDKQEGTNLITGKNGKSLGYAGYKYHYDNLLDSFNMKHTLHETRHTFRSRMDSAGANKVAIDRIMGHVVSDVGERVYTHKTIQQLHEAIELLD